MSSVNTVGRVRALYKAILKLHKALPPQMQVLGDRYVTDEFRHHKSANAKEAEIFMQEWSKYYITVATQLSSKKTKKIIGAQLSPELLDCFKEEQLGQLHELYQEIYKPLGNDR